jgi:hypothetical protein
MYVRFLCNWPPYRDGACIEVLDRFGSHFVARAMAQVVTASVVREYNRTMAAVDRAIERRINAPEMPARGGRRVTTEDEWRRELGADRTGYQRARQAYIAKRVNVSPGHLADITVRS